MLDAIEQSKEAVQPVENAAKLGDKGEKAELRSKREAYDVSPLPNPSLLPLVLLTRPVEMRAMCSYEARQPPSANIVWPATKS